MKITILSCFLIISNLACITQCYAQSPLNQSIGSILIDLGHKFNVRFTIESTYRDSLEYENLSRSLPTIPMIENEGSLLAQIPQLMPGYIAKKEKNSNVINLIKKDLLDDKEYWLNHITERILFDGTVIDYIPYLDSKTDRLTLDTSRVSGNGPISIDFQLKIKMDDKYLTIRQGLSDCFPQKYSRILWSATTDLKNNRTFIQIPGTGMDH
jgi:hypothetical protein